MKTMKLENGDVVRDGGRPVLIEGVEALRQRLTHRLTLQTGEWFRDAREGVDWLSILQQKDGRERARKLLSAAVLKDAEVVRILDLAVELNRATRDVAFRLKVETVYGPVTVEP